MYIYLYINIYLYIEREREADAASFTRTGRESERQQVTSPSSEREKGGPDTWGVRASVSNLQQRVVREKTPGPSCPQNPAGGLSACSCWSCNQ